jgi:hypothetical protein
VEGRGSDILNSGLKALVAQFHSLRDLSALGVSAVIFLGEFTAETQTPQRLRRENPSNTTPEDSNVWSPVTAVIHYVFIHFCTVLSASASRSVDFLYAGKTDS